MDVLVDSWITVELSSGVRRLGLARLLEELSKDTVEELPRLRPHQEHIFYMLVAQLAGLVDARSEAGGVADWDGALRSLAGDSASAWCLFAPRTQPAFLQPAMHGLDPKRVQTPDALDILVTAKNHDLKRGVIDPCDVELWLYALIALQTAQGFSGAGCYGIARMNGGYGNRPLVNLTGQIRWGQRFQADRDRMRSTRAAALTRFGSRCQSPLLWTIPWNGRTSLDPSEIDPWAIEVCRQIRLEREQDRIFAVTLTSTAPRVAASHMFGDVGDPWVPVSDGKSLTIGSSGFHARVVADILAMGVAGVTIHATALARGQGKTEGFHQRSIAVPAMSDAQRDAAILRLYDWLELTKKIKLKALFPSIRALGAKAVELSERWISALSSQVDAEILPHLFQSLEDPAAAELKFRVLLRDLGGQALVRISRSIPVPSARRWTARLDAEITYRHASAAVLERFPGELPWWGSEVRKELASDRDHELVDALMSGLRLLSKAQISNLRRGDRMLSTKLWEQSGMPSSYPDAPGSLVTTLIGAIAILRDRHEPHAALGGAISMAEISGARLGSLLSARGDQLIARVRSISGLIYDRGARVDVSQIISLVLTEDGDLADDVRRGVLASYVANKKPNNWSRT